MKTKQHKKNYFFIALGLLMVAVIILTGILVYLQTTNGSKTSSTENILKEKERVVIATSWLPNSFYPESESEKTTANLITHVFEPLVAFDDQNQLVGRLASAWNNPDDLTWRFYINKAATFSNGEPVTASDVKFSYDYLVSNKLPAADLLPEIKSINIINDKEFTMTTEKINPILVNRLSNFFILSKSEVEANGIKNYIGSGPYLLSELGESQLKLTRNESYWGVKPLVKSAVFQKVTDEAESIRLLRSGKIDVVTYSQDNEAQIAKLASDGRVKISKSPHGGIDFICLDAARDKSPYVDTAKNPLKDLRVRKAMYMAINIDQIISDSPGEAKAVSQIVTRGVFGYNPSIARFDFDMEKARQLLTEAGYKSGFTIRFDYHNTPRNKAIVDSIVKQLAEIGITATPKGFDSLDDFYAMTDARDSSMYKSAYATDSFDASEVLELQVHTPADPFGIYNLGYSNSQVDELIEKASATTDQASRKNYLQQAMKLSSDDVAVIPLFEYYDLYAYSKGLYWQPRLDGAIRVDEMAGA